MLSNFTHFISLMIWAFLTRDMPKKYTRTNFAGGYGFHGANVCYYMRTGKKKSGSMVDGVEYKQFPSGGSADE